jgi:hypothetical protein
MLKIALGERAALQELAMREPAPEPDPSRASLD